MTKIKFKKDVLICFILAILTLCFIFWNSLQGSVESNAQSGFFVALIQKIMGLSDEMLDLASYVVRKLAHFSEFAILGMEIAYLKKRVNFLLKHSWSYTFLFGLLVALIDESLQRLSDRTSSVTDVWLDFAGFLFGILLLIVIYAIMKKKFKKREEETK